MSSDANVKAYRKVKRWLYSWTICNPDQEEGAKLLPSRKTFFGMADPNQRENWQLAHGKMKYSKFSYSKQEWDDFRDYENYVSNLPNFFRWEEVEDIEEAEENNGFEVVFEPIWCLTANPEELDQFRKLNIVGKNGKYAMAKQTFGRKTFERYLIQTGFEVDFQS